jgi:isoleucyl-tRNA synthetase
MFKAIDNNVNFPEMEKKWLDHWYKNGIVKKYLQKNNPSTSLRTTERFSFIDGPITANNPMGVHHAWGRTYKDLWPRFFNLLGYRQRFQNGFDCQGLWVEVEVEKELSLKYKKDIENLVPRRKKDSIAKFVELCKERVRKFAKIQTEQSKRLGYFADWDRSYFTMSDENNYMIWHFLKKCFEHGWIYKGRDSVPWCPRCETAISEHEMLTEDYKEVTHESVILEFKVKNPAFAKATAGKQKLLVWTTTPWTIPANIAVAVDKDLEYSLVEVDGNLFWLAKETIGRVFNVGVGHDRPVPKVIKTVKGKELVGLKYQGPFDDLPAVKKVAEKNPKFHTVVATDKTILPVTTEEGTGLVHTAVSAGTEDFKLGKKYGLPMIPVIADNANYLPGLGFLSGKNAKKNPRLILDYLVEQHKKGFDCVFDIFPYKHRYPACWRCKTELVWKVEDEWYVAMDKSPLRVQGSRFKVQGKKQNTKTLRQRMIEVAKKIKWIPEFGLERELDWLKNMHDWLISKKNRYWGLALPIYECKKCGNFEVIGSKEELKKRAVTGWKKFNGHSPHKPWIDEVKITCSKCGAKISRIDDVGNPWLDAGIVAFSTITQDNRGEPLYLTDRKEWKKWFPADFITESFPGQFKNWFYSLIAMSTVLENKPPFRTVLGFATLLGEDGRPMHKSWGNAIEFNEGAEKIGVDVMRWMYCRQNPQDNLLFGYKKADEVRRQFYLMLWNVYKFFVEYANLDGFHPREVRSVTLRVLKHPQGESILDQWILRRFVWLVQLVEKSLKNYNAKDAALEIEKFVTNLSTWYIRRSRERVWVNSEAKNDKESFYQTLYYVLVNLSIIISPFLPFISEEIYTNLTDRESVHLSSWPKLGSRFKVQGSRLIEDMDLVRQIVEVGHRVRKDKKLKVRQPLKKVKIKLPKTRKFISKENLEQYLNLIKGELNVKEAILAKNKTDGIAVNYDTKLTDKLKKEGEARELIRRIQNERKKLRLKPDQFIKLEFPDYPVEYESLIRRKTMAKNIKRGKKLVISY